MELEGNAEVKQNIINVQNAQPNIKVVQDHLLMCYLMTYKWTPLKKSEFQQLCCILKYSINEIQQKIYSMKSVYKKLNKSMSSFYNSKTLFSMCFPKTLCFEFESKLSETEPLFKVYNGVILSGCINKGVMNSGMGLISHIHKEYGKHICADFIDNVCKLTYEWIFYRGFSIGYSDCIVKSDNNIDTILNKCYIKASIAEQETNPKIRELKVTSALNEARDVGNNLSKKGLDLENNIRHMVLSGAKGDFNNLAQIVGIVGQQNSEVGRLPLQLAHNHKALYCYPDDDDMTDQSFSETRYESRGFNKSSYMDGLNPKEFWNHAVTGRIGLYSTALLTADTGYIQRRMCKVFENIKIAYDGTVRGSNNSIIQFAYGGDGLSEDRIVKTNKGFKCCNVKRIIDKLNCDVEQRIRVSKNNVVVVNT